jgi:hypothetical protein
MRTDRRNPTALGRKRRREFDRSVQKLRALGMPDWAVEYFRRAARVAGLAPHMIVCHVAVVAAGRQLQASIAQDQPVERPASSHEPAGVSPREAPSYTSVRTLRERVTSLWREIERHGSLTGVQPQGVSANKLASRLTLLRPEAPHPDQAAARARRRKASTGKSH